MSRRRRFAPPAALILPLLIGILSASCRHNVDQKATVSEQDRDPRCSCLTWDAELARTLTWQAENPAFGQDHALEASGLAASERFLYVTSEKFAAVLQIDLADGFRARILPLAVPALSELEGIDLRNGSLFMCDEAHAAVYRFDLGDEARFASGTGVERLPATELPLEGLDVQGGKIGFEGIAVAPGGQRLYLLLERSGSDDQGCASIIYPLEVREGSLHLFRDPIVVRLEDCNWRLTALELCDGRLLALKTRYPGEEYVILEIDPQSGDWSEVFELTELARAITADGWGNNLEGLAVAPDGRLFLVSDNAVTDTMEIPSPPPTEELAVLLELPLGCPDRGAAE